MGTRPNLRISYFLQEAFFHFQSSKSKSSLNVEFFYKSFLFCLLIRGSQQCCI